MQDRAEASLFHQHCQLLSKNGKPRRNAPVLLGHRLTLPPPQMNSMPMSFVLPASVSWTRARQSPIPEPYDENDRGETQKEKPESK
jgi:hypothetical protein